MRDLRQTDSWSKYLSSIGWKTEKINGTLALIRPIPFLNRSIIKIQHHTNPLSFEKLDGLSKKHKAVCIILEPEPKGFKEEAFKKHGFRKTNIILTHSSTTQINLVPSLNKILRSFSENARRNIIKANKNKLSFKKISLKNEKEDLEFKKFYELLQTLSKNKKFWIPNYGEFYKKMLAFKNNSYLYFAYQKGGTEPMAVLWIAAINKRAFYMHVGITKDGYKMLANYLLVWEVLKDLKKMGVKLFDFEGIFDSRFPKEKKSWANFSEFKKRFHGNIIEYPQPLIKFNNLILKLIYLCNQILPS